MVVYLYIGVIVIQNLNCPCDNQEKLSETIKNALENKESFLNGPIFKPNAEEILNKYFSDLKEQLELLLLN